MISNGESVHAQRVVLAVDAISSHPLMIELAVDLAASMKSQLQALLVEDVDLFSIASLPFSREICLATGQPRTLDIQQLQKRLDNIGQQFRQLLAKKAEQSVVQWSYATVRTRKQDLPLGEYADAAYLILEQSTRNPQRRTHPSTINRILLIKDHAENLYRALDTISQKLGGSHIELMVVPVAAESPSDQDKVWLTSGPSVQNRRLHYIDLDQVEQLMTLRTDYFDYVLITRNAETAILQKIIRWSTCPVIVVS
ncbi:MAG: hypothetical protein K9K86_03225 [Pseudomonadales bacterium]|nr:hypothetical protein [Pseudomonadales bacterium]